MNGSPKIERRFRQAGGAGGPTGAKVRAGGAAGDIVGYGAVFYDGTHGTEYELWSYGSERCVERVVPGAFDEALARPDDVRGLFNHNADNLLGRSAAGTLKLKVDRIGLRYEIVADDTSVARDVLAHLRRGDVTGSSFAFRVDEERWSESKEGSGLLVVREILSVTLYDVGPVTYPAYTGASSGPSRADYVAGRGKPRASGSPDYVAARLRVVELAERN